MKWLIFALIGPIFWALTNHVDKYLVEKFFKKNEVGENSVGTLVIFTGLAAFFVSIFVLIFNPEVFFIHPLHALIATIAGVLLVSSFIPFLQAIEREEASTVTALWQMTPVFAYILSYFILGETLSPKQILAGLLIITGAILISVNFENRKAKVKSALLGRMALASFLAALSIVIFKTIAIEESYWASIFWNELGGALLAIFLFACISSYRTQFLKVLKKNAGTLLAMNSASELLNIGAGLSFRYAILLAPIALVELVNTLQPFFGFLIGILLTLFMPSFGVEKIGRKDIARKSLAIIIIFIGTYFLIVI